jgi:hypothetical protein
VTAVCPVVAQPGGGLNLTPDGGVIPLPDAGAAAVPPSDWPLTVLPDSHVRCDQAGLCAGAGTDDDWSFPVESMCSAGERVRTDSSGVLAVPFLASQQTGIIWQSDDVGATVSSSQVAGACVGATWLGASGHIVLPTPTALIDLMDLGVASPDGMFPSALVDRTAGAYWAQTVHGALWQVDFDTGEFSKTTASTAAHVRCVDVATAAAPVPSFTCLSSGQGSVCSARLGNAGSGSPTTGLTYGIGNVATPLPWDDALDACDQLLGCNWRLPSYKELAALLNFTDTPTGLPPIDNLQGVYWSSTAARGGADRAMAVDFGAGTASSAVGGSRRLKAQAANVLCVR